MNRQHDGQQHADRRRGQRGGNPDARGDLAPEDAPERHPAHEHDDERRESSRAHPLRQGQLRGDLQGGQDRDPGDTGRKHGERQESDILDMGERQRGHGVKNARPGDQRIA